MHQNNTLQHDRLHKAILALVLAILLGGSAWFYRQQSQSYRRQVEDTLVSIANAKSSEISNLLYGQLDDGRMVSTRPELAEDVQEFLVRPSDQVTAKIRENLLSIQRRGHYIITMLVDSDCRVLLSSDEDVILPKGWWPAFAKALQKREPILTDLSVPAQKKASRQAVIAPILSRSVKNSKQAIAAVVLIIDPTRKLYPIIDSLPTIGRTEEAMVVRSDGNQAVILNTLHQHLDVSMDRYIPLTRTDDPAVMAVSGRTGIQYGKDFWGNKVVAAIVPIVNSSSYLVVKVDVAEAFADWRFHSVMMFILLVTAVALAGVLLITAQQRTQKVHYRSLYHAEGKLRASMEKQAVTLQAIGDGVIATDVHGKVELVNAAAQRITGWPQEDALGRPLSQIFCLINEESRQLVEDPVSRVISENRVGPGAKNHLLLTRDGREIPIADSGAPIRGEGGNIIGVVVIFRDQSAKRLASKISAARLSLIEYATDHNLDQLLTRALDLIGEIAQSPIGFFHFVEPDQTTLSLQQWSTRTLQEFCRTDGKGTHYDIDQAGIWVDCVREKKTVIHNDYSALTEKKGLPSGHVRVVRELVVPVMRDGQIKAILGVGNKEGDYTEKDAEIVTYLADVTWDIVGQKQADSERERLSHQLHQAQKMETIGRLAGGVAHDFNNMLSVIIGCTQMALTKVDQVAPLHQDLQEILDAGKRSADITRQLLAFARKQAIAPLVLDINAVIEGMLKMLRRLIGEDIHLVWKPKVDAWSVKMDPAQIDQILANLCINARDAITDTGKITIETGNVVFDQKYCADHLGFVPGHFFFLAVSDDGKGMDKETIGNIFEPFFTTKELGRGTGLGLATVFGIVKQNDGFINVYSEPEAGSTFKIYLPRYLNGTAVESPRQMEQDLVGKGEMVLVVEDENAILRLAENLLKELNYQVLTTQSPAEALTLAARHAAAIDLLITDVVMPEMNGRELSERIRAFCPNLKHLFMSGYTANVIAHHGVLDVGVPFLAKPFSKEDMAAKVREALEA